MALIVTIWSGVSTAPADAAASVTTPSGPFANNQSITVSGSGFAKRATGSTIQILMCSDPGGQTANLPHDITSCDGTTQNPNTIVPTAEGNFNDKYTIVKLSTKPTSGIESTINCDATHYCVLWVGEDQVDNFFGTSKQPVAYSQPFLVGATGSTNSSAGSGSSSGAVVAIVIAVVVVVGGGGAFLWFRRRRTA